MAKTLVIGATCVDLIIHVPEFPKAGEDVNFDDSKMELGGTAFNIACALQSKKSEFILCSPVGAVGHYADFVRNELAKKEIPIFTEIPNKENGVCCCLINKKNEHAFLCSHKAEYIFDEKFFEKIDISEIDSVYFSGLEMEEKNAEKEIDFIVSLKAAAEKNGKTLKIFFDPTSRAMFIKKKLIKKIYALNPILHLNKQEALDLSGADNIIAAAAFLSGACKNDIILTLGKSGALVYEYKTGNAKKVPGVKTKVVSTIGCGDAHLGICIALLKNGAMLYDAVLSANEYAAKVAGLEKAHL